MNIIRINNRDELFRFKHEVHKNCYSLSIMLRASVDFPLFAYYNAEDEGNKFIADFLKVSDDKIRDFKRTKGINVYDADEYIKIFFPSKFNKKTGDFDNLKLNYIEILLQKLSTINTKANGCALQLMSINNNFIGTENSQQKLRETKINNDSSLYEELYDRIKCLEHTVDFLNNEIGRTGDIMGNKND